MWYSKANVKFIYHSITEKKNPSLLNKQMHSDIKYSDGCLQIVVIMVRMKFQVSAEQHWLEASAVGRAVVCVVVDFIDVSSEPLWQTGCWKLVSH